jgi:hypothetical protein
MKHFFLLKSDLRDTNKMFKKKKEKKSCLCWGLNPRPSVTKQLTVVLVYLNTLQSGGNALDGSYLKQISAFNLIVHVNSKFFEIYNL